MVVIIGSDMKIEKSVEIIDCPYCGSRDYSMWAEERGFTAVRCTNCAFIYVNPRPTLELINLAVKTGVHEAQKLNVKTRRIDARVARYRRVFSRLFADVWRSGEPVSWLDLGAGYGEIVEAVGELAPAGSQVEGVEPMKHKAVQAMARGLAITEGYLRPTHPKVGFISVVDVFSHIPHFGKFLVDVKSVLLPGGEIFIETGNLANLNCRDDFPGELGLPDHLVFAGEEHLYGYLEKAGFELLRTERVRVDGVTNFAKNLVKKLLGRPVKLGLPYRSSYRSLMVRARLRLTPMSPNGE